MLFSIGEKRYKYKIKVLRGNLVMSNSVVKYSY